MNRRNFVKNSLALSAFSFAGNANFLTPTPLLKKIGIQFFSLPFLLEKDFSGALVMLSKMGYKEVELYGPYTFSTATAQKNWAALGNSLGFTGSGFFGHTAKEVKSMLNANGLKATSMHTDLDTLENGIGKLCDAANEIGSKYVVLPAIPEARRKNLDDYKKMADVFNKIGADAKKSGVKFGYHNHGYGWKPVEGVTPISLILDGTDKDSVFFEMDLYWTTAGGADPIQLFEKYKNRYHLMHVKDMAKNVRFSGDGGESSQWIELFPYMTTAGNGVLDLKNILAKAKASGVKHFFVEQDMVKEPEIALKKSIDYLSKL